MLPKIETLRSVKDTFMHKKRLITVQEKIFTVHVSDKDKTPCFQNL